MIMNVTIICFILQMQYNRIHVYINLRDEISYCIFIYFKYMSKTTSSSYGGYGFLKSVLSVDERK